MARRWLLHAILVCFVVLGFPSVSRSQYMYLDANGDGVNTSADALNSIEEPTVVDVYLTTNRNADGSPAQCASGSDSLNVVSYCLILEAVGGSVTYSDFVNQQSRLGAAFGELNTGNGYYKNGYGGTTPLAPGGPYLLCSLVITASEGNPSIQIVPSFAGSPERTGFGTSCLGSDFDNTYKLDSDWFDVSGLIGSESLNSQPQISAPVAANCIEGEFVSISASATDSDLGQSISMSPTGFPPTLALSRENSDPRSVTVTLSGTPRSGEAGRWTIRWVATDTGLPSRSAFATTILTVAGAGTPPLVSAPASVQASASAPVVFDVTVAPTDSLSVTGLSAGPLPFGAFFVPDPTRMRGKFSWSPNLSERGVFRITFRARTSGAVGESTTVITVTGAPGARRARVSPELRGLVRGDPRSERFLSRDAQGNAFVEAFGVGDVTTTDLEARGISVGARSGRIMTVRCPLDRIESLFDTPGLEAVVAPTQCQPMLDSSLVSERVAGLRTFYPPFKGQVGDSVVVGFVDTGIDVNHYDFRNVDGTTRLLGFWDQTVTGTPPPGLYGVEWTPALINAGLSGASKDVSGHGTHVAAIAAGNGQGGTACKDKGLYVGVAPEANLCAVKTNFTTTGIYDGVSYILGKASQLNRPVVVNLSLGTHDGPHDGTSLFDHAINGYTGAGKIVVAAAGNDAVSAVHATAIPHFVGDTATLTFDVDPYTPIAGLNILEISGWFDYNDSIEVTVITPNNFTVGPVAYHYQDTGLTDDGAVGLCVTGTCSNQIFSPPGDFRISIYDNGSHHPADGTWTVRIKLLKLESTTGRADLYMALGTFAARWDQETNSEGVVTEPATADSVIAVGAYTTRDCWRRAATITECEAHSLALGQIADFSSHGPRRDNVLKPDLAAPGGDVVSAKSADASFFVDQPQYVVEGGGHAVLWGTSQAAPQVAGAVALLLAQPDSLWKTATPSRIKARLQGTCRGDTDTGTLPNYTWGYGKLDVRAALAPVYSLSILHPSRGSYIGPSPDSITVLVGGQRADSVVFDLAVDSCRNYSIRIGRLLGVDPGTPRSLSFFADTTLSTSQASLRARAWAGDSLIANVSEAFFYLQSPTAVEVEPGPPPVALELLQNAPNPFNPVTVLRFQVGQAGPVTLRIYAVGGRVIRTLVRGSLPSGRFRVMWDGRDDRGSVVASGLYLSELVSGRQRATRKMNLLR